MATTSGSRPWPARCSRALLLAALLLPALPARALCPDDLCDCLPDASSFATVASKVLTVKTGSIRVSGSPEFFAGVLNADACANTAKVSGSQDDPSETENLTCLAPTGITAVKLSTKKVTSGTGEGVLIHGDLATAGGSVFFHGVIDDVVEGDVSIDGTDPSVVPCQNAMTDLASASAALSAPPLSPTQPSLGKLTVKGVVFTINATDPGVNVIQADKITISPLVVSGSPEGGNLDIVTDSATTAVIIITPKLTVGKNSSITAAEPEKVIFNVTGIRGHVSIGNEAEVQTAILAAGQPITVGVSADVANLYGTSVTVKGANVDDTLGCEPLETTTTTETTTTETSTSSTSTSTSTSSSTSASTTSSSTTTTSSSTTSTTAPPTCPAPDAAGCCVVTSGGITVCSSGLGESGNQAGALAICAGIGGTPTADSCDKVAACNDFPSMALVGCCSYGTAVSAPLNCFSFEQTASNPGAVSTIFVSQCVTSGGTAMLGAHCPVTNRCLHPSSCGDYPCIGTSDCATLCSPAGLTCY